MKLYDKFHSTHLSTRSMAKEVYNDLSKHESTALTLDFSDIEFASRSFMVQLYSMLAQHRSQVRYINMNEIVDRMYQLAVTAYNTPSVLPDQNSSSKKPEIVFL